MIADHGSGYQQIYTVMLIRLANIPQSGEQSRHIWRLVHKIPVGCLAVSPISLVSLRKERIGLSADTPYFVDAYKAIRDGQ